MWAFSADGAMSCQPRMNRRCWKAQCRVEARRCRGMSILSPASKLGAMTQVPIAELQPRDRSRPGRTHGGSSRSRRCVAGRVRRRPVERRPRQSVAGTWRAVGRSVNRQVGRGGWSGEGLVELVVVVVMVLSRARQRSEERDFGNEWPDGRAPVPLHCQITSQANQSQLCLQLLVGREAGWGWH